jgi:hypothetical protein
MAERTNGFIQRRQIFHHERLCMCSGDPSPSSAFVKHTR